MIGIKRSATIHQFPNRMRPPYSAGRFETKASAEFRASDAPQVMSGSGWYHETAMQDARRPIKH